MSSSLSFIIHNSPTPSLLTKFSSSSSSCFASRVPLVSYSISSSSSTGTISTSSSKYTTRSCIINSSQFTRRTLPTFVPTLASINTNHASISSSAMFSSLSEEDNIQEQLTSTITPTLTSTSTPSYFKTSQKSSNNVIEIDIHSYLSSIENELQSNQTFQIKIRPQNSRPMIRTLLGIPSKDEFYQLCRMTRNQLEYKKMFDFAVLFKEDVLKYHDLKYVEERLPNFHSILLDHDHYVITTPSTVLSLSSSSPKRDVQCISRLASGRVYKGKFIDMVQDLTPHLVEQCHDAMTSIPDAQILLAVIDKIHADNANLSSSSKSSRVISKERIEAAKRCVINLHDFSDTNSNSSSSTNTNNDDDDENNTKNNNPNGNIPKLNGIECEQACISYLEDQKYYHNYSSTCSTSSNSDKDQQNFIILQNVVVNHKSTQNRSKYSDGNMKNSQGGWKRYSIDEDATIETNNQNISHVNNSEETNNNNITSTGIIWSSHQGGRDKLCSEFDALVVHKVSDTHCHVSECWEAKYLVSPSSLHDAITKKLSSIRSVVEDKDAMISYNGSHYTLNGNSDIEETNMIKFGLFGMELLSPQNAIGQLKSTAASFLLTNYEDVALTAAETGYVEVKVDHLLSQLNGLKHVLEQNNDFEIIVKIVK